MKDETEVRTQYTILSKELHQVQRNRTTAILINDDTQDKLCIQEMTRIKTKIETLDWVLNNR